MASPRVYNDACLLLSKVRAKRRYSLFRRSRDKATRPKWERISNLALFKSDAVRHWQGALLDACFTVSAYELRLRPVNDGRWQRDMSRQPISE